MTAALPPTVPAAIPAVIHVRRELELLRNGLDAEPELAQEGLEEAQVPPHPVDHAGRGANVETVD